MFNWLLGGTETAKKTVDTISDSVKGIGGWIDEQQFTEEEQAKAKADLLKQHTEFLRLAYDQNSIRAITRRGLAWAIGGVFLLGFIVGVVLAIREQFQTIQVIIELVRVFWLGEIMLAVTAFYFGSQILSKGR